MEIAVVAIAAWTWLTNTVQDFAQNHYVLAAVVFLWWRINILEEELRKISALLREIKAGVWRDAKM